MTIRTHPLRATLAEEMHLRRLPRFEAPYRLMQIRRRCSARASAKRSARAYRCACRRGAGDRPGVGQIWRAGVRRRHAGVGTAYRIRDLHLASPRRPPRRRSIRTTSSRCWRGRDRDAGRGRTRHPGRAGRRGRRARSGDRRARPLVRARGDDRLRCRRRHWRGSCPISGSTPMAMAGCWCSIRGSTATSRRSW